jgi:hypothetical protein
MFAGDAGLALPEPSIVVAGNTSDINGNITGSYLQHFIFNPSLQLLITETGASAIAMTCVIGTKGIFPVVGRHWYPQRMSLRVQWEQRCRSARQGVPGSVENMLPRVSFGIAYPDAASAEAPFGGDFQHAQTNGMNLGVSPLRADQSQAP